MNSPLSKSFGVTLRVIGVLLLVIASPAASAAEDPVPLGSSIEQLAISLADTPEQHATIAAFYADKAAEARAAAARHQSMATTYSGKREAFALHCRNLVRVYSELAREYDALASGHRAASTTGHEHH